MKKSKLLIAPLLLAPFLASCGSTEYKVSIPDINGLTISETKVTKGKDYVGTISIDATKIADKLLPDKLDKVTSGNKELQPTEYTYTLKDNNLSADFKIPATNVVGDIQIQLTLVDKPEPTKKWYEHEDWWNYCSDGTSIQATEEDIGQEVSVTLNFSESFPHKVRLIGVDHDTLANENGKKAHCTFEFENVITDASGIALTTHWDESASESSKNYDFPNSTLNKFLNGTEQSNDDSVLDMLPEGLQGAIQEVQKLVATGSGYGVTTYGTKLFPLSYREITEIGSSEWQVDEGSTYAFYTGGTGDTNSNRIKKTINGDNGEKYWLRSPYTDNSDHAWNVYGTGGFGNYNVYDSALAVAPAFCI